MFGLNGQRVYIGVVSQIYTLQILFKVWWIKLSLSKFDNHLTLLLFSRSIP